MHAPLSGPSWTWAGVGHLGPSWQTSDRCLLSLKQTDLTRHGYHGDEAGPQQQQAVVLAIIGILAFIFIIGGVLVYRFRRPAQSQKTEEKEVNVYLPTVTIYVQPLCRTLEVPALQ